MFVSLKRVAETGQILLLHGPLCPGWAVAAEGHGDGKDGQEDWKIRMPCSVQTIPISFIMRKVKMWGVKENGGI